MESHDGTLQQLIAAARQGDWVYIDQVLPELCDRPDVVAWALGQGLGDPAGELRDLAASIIEQSHCQLDAQNIQELTTVMMTDADPYASYHAAFALFIHGDRTNAVIEKIETAMGDPEVVEMAGQYVEIHRKEASVRKTIRGLMSE